MQMMVSLSHLLPPQLAINNSIIPFWGVYLIYINRETCLLENTVIDCHLSGTLNWPIFGYNLLLLLPSCLQALEIENLLVAFQFLTLIKLLISQMGISFVSL